MNEEIKNINLKIDKMYVMIAQMKYQIKELKEENFKLHKKIEYLKQGCVSEEKFDSLIGHIMNSIEQIKLKNIDLLNSQIEERNSDETNIFDSLFDDDPLENYNTYNCGKIIVNSIDNRPVLSEDVELLSLND